MRVALKNKKPRVPNGSPRLVKSQVVQSTGSRVGARFYANLRHAQKKNTACEVDMIIVQTIAARQRVVKIKMQRLATPPAVRVTGILRVPNRSPRQVSAHGVCLPRAQIPSSSASRLSRPAGPTAHSQGRKALDPRNKERQKPRRATATDAASSSGPQTIETIPSNYRRAP